MNVFENLIEELKEENLLEETVIDLSKGGQTVSEGLEFTKETAPSIVRNDEFDNIGADAAIHETESPLDGREFYRKRAMEEVSSLQMVEHVISGVEREHMKMTPNSFDDLEVKKALHRYLQVAGDPESDSAEAESDLMRETQNWFSALAKRDSDISVANIRRFCENSKPVLSSQALMALARFYRNSPFSEPIRGKFDFVMTRLFSREIGEEKRKLLFGRMEMIGHIKTLYANWSSLALFPEAEDTSTVRTAVEEFGKLSSEAENAGSFESMIAGGLFNRIRLFKEESNELFFEAEVTAAAIDCNVRTGNRFVDLIKAEREAGPLETIEAKYGYTYDSVISSAAGKTLLLVEVLKGEQDDQHEFVGEEVEEKAAPVRMDFERAPVEELSGLRLFAVNKWLVFVTILILLSAGGVYFWSASAEEVPDDVAVATTVRFSDPALRQHFRLGRVSEETLYAVTLPTWDTLSQDEQKAMLQKVLEYARSIKMSRVNVLNNKGKTVAFASADRSELFGSQ